MSGDIYETTTAEANRAMAKRGIKFRIKEPESAADAPHPPKGNGDAGTDRSETPLSDLLDYKRLSDYELKPIEWLWKGRIPRGKHTHIGGYPGLGKSQILDSLTAIVTTGGQWPVDRTQCEAGNVIILSAEDDAADTIGPRLKHVGCDLSRVTILEAAKTTKGRRRALNLNIDVEALCGLVEEIGNVSIVRIDPINSYVGATDTNNDAQWRVMLSPLVDMAAQYGFALVTVGHLNKKQGASALDRFGGSMGLVASARVAYLVCADPDNPKRKLMVPAKCNIARDDIGFAFGTHIDEVADFGEISSILWEDEYEYRRADDLIQMASLDSDDRSELDEACEFLRQVLQASEDWTVSANSVYAQAEKAGIAKITMRRAKKKCGIKSKKHEGSWVWIWPSHENQDDQDDQGDQHYQGANMITLPENSQDDHHTPPDNHDHLDHLDHHDHLETGISPARDDTEKVYREIMAGRKTKQ